MSKTKFGLHITERWFYNLLRFILLQGPSIPLMYFNHGRAWWQRDISPTPSQSQSCIKRVV